jgi:hypothetical protein
MTGMNLSFGKASGSCLIKDNSESTSAIAFLAVDTDVDRTEEDTTHDLSASVERTEKQTYFETLPGRADFRSGKV